MIRRTVTVLSIIAILMPGLAAAQMREPGMKEPKLPGIDRQRRLPGIREPKLPDDRTFDNFKPTHGPLANCDLPYQDGQRLALPDDAMAKAVGTATAGIGSAKPRPDPARMVIAPEAPASDREARRVLLATESALGGQHLEAFRTYDAQVSRLDAVAGAIALLRGLQGKHERRAQTNDMPTLASLTYIKYRATYCEAIYGSLRVGIDLNRTHAADLEIAAPVATILLAPLDAGIRPATPNSSPLGECGAYSLNGWICAPLSSSFTPYYFNDTYTCKMQGLLSAEPGKEPVFGCVDYRRNDGAKPSLDALRSFYNALDDGVAMVVTARARFTAARGALTAGDATAATELSRQLTVETDDLVAWRTALDALKAEIDALMATIAGEEKNLADATAGQAAKVAILGAAEQEVAAIDQSIAASEAALADLDQALSQAQAAEQSVKIECGSANAATCADAKAKLDYERRRYEARQVVMECRQKRVDARLALSDLKARRRAKVADLQASRIAIVPLRATIARMNMLLPQHHGQRDVRVAKYDQEAPAQTRLATGNTKDRATLANLSALIAAGR